MEIHREASVFIFESSVQKPWYNHTTSFRIIGAEALVPSYYIISNYWCRSLGTIMLHHFHAVVRHIKDMCGNTIVQHNFFPYKDSTSVDVMSPLIWKEWPWAPVLLQMEIRRELLCIEF
ncbi:hypothetical protein HNY73_020789 [Argiope bruennichi]|uniref:Uncharacterized protein n=1 Tax=Argiope bruennichi TaxID=94029 RepID=A0A8T0ECM8_ARGBR|nr:hypothetical protein HNY73_020789 [Argiope bruennichi]